MDAKQKNGFEIGKLDGLTWAEIEGYAAEVEKEDGSVFYRGQYLCTTFNDEDGGDILDENGNHMTDDDVQAAINKIDRNI